MREDKDALSPDGPPEVTDEYVALAADVFSLLADTTRIRIVLALTHGEQSVNELALLVGRPQTAVSQHLAKLRWGHVVTTRQEGTRVYYRLIDEHARNLVTQAIYQAEHVVDRSPSHHRTTEDAR